MSQLPVQEVPSRQDLLLVYGIPFFAATTDLFWVYSSASRKGPLPVHLVLGIHRIERAAPINDN